MALNIIEGAEFGLNSAVVARFVGRAQAKFGLPHFTAHDLRRTALTKMAELGVPPIVLGHVNLSKWYREIWSEEGFGKVGGWGERNG